MVARMAASTFGWVPNLPGMRSAARSSSSSTVTRLFPGSAVRSGLGQQVLQEELVDRPGDGRLVPGLDPGGRRLGGGQRARTMPTVVPTVPRASSAAAVSPINTGPPVPRARTSAPCTGPSAARPAPARGSGTARRPRRTPLAVSYRRSRSFARAFITIQSSSPRTNRPSLRRLGLPVGRDARRRLRRAQPACSASAAPARGSAAASRRSAAFLTVSRVERRGAGQQLVQDHAEGVDVGPGVHVQGVERRPAPGPCTAACRAPLPNAGEQRLLGQLQPGRSPWPARSR